MKPQSGMGGTVRKQTIGGMNFTKPGSVAGGRTVAGGIKMDIAGGAIATGMIMTMITEVTGASS